MAAQLDLVSARLPTAFMLWVLAALSYRIVGFDIPRARSAGIPPWVLILFVIPFVNLAVALALFFAPPKEACGRELRGR